jgi:hypothetical protein
VNIKTKPSVKYQQQEGGRVTLFKGDSKSATGSNIYAAGSNGVLFASARLQDVDWEQELDIFYRCVDVSLQSRDVASGVDNHMDKLILCSAESDKNHVSVQINARPGIDSALAKLLFRDPSKVSADDLGQFRGVLDGMLTTVQQQQQQQQAGGGDAYCDKIDVPQLAVLYLMLVSSGVRGGAVLMAHAPAGAHMLHLAAQALLLCATRHSGQPWRAWDVRRRRLWSCCLLLVSLQSTQLQQQNQQKDVSAGKAAENAEVGAVLASCRNDAMSAWEVVMMACHHSQNQNQSSSGDSSSELPLLPLWVCYCCMTAPTNSNSNSRSGSSSSDSDSALVSPIVIRALQSDIFALLANMQACLTGSSGGGTSTSPSARTAAFEKVAMVVVDMLSLPVSEEESAHSLLAAGSTVMLLLDHLLLRYLQIINNQASGGKGAGAGVLSYAGLISLLSAACSSALRLHRQQQQQQQSPRQWLLLLAMRAQQCASLLAHIHRRTSQAREAATVAIAVPSQKPIAPGLPIYAAPAPTVAASVSEQEQWQVGDKVEGLCTLSNGTQRWYAGSIQDVANSSTKSSSSSSNGLVVTVLFSDGEVKEGLSADHLRLPRAEMMRRKKEAKLKGTLPASPSAAKQAPPAFRQAGLCSPEQDPPRLSSSQTQSEIEPQRQISVSPPLTPEGHESGPPPLAMSTSPDLRAKGRHASADGDDTEGLMLPDRWDSSLASALSLCPGASGGGDSNNNHFTSSNPDLLLLVGNADFDGGIEEEDDGDDDGSVLDIPTAFEADDIDRQDAMRKSFSDSGLVPVIPMRRSTSGSSTGGGGVLGSTGGSSVSLGLPGWAASLENGNGSAPGSLALSFDNASRTSLSRGPSPDQLSASLATADGGASGGVWALASAAFEAHLLSSSSSPSPPSDDSHKEVVIAVREACELLAALMSLAVVSAAQSSQGALDFAYSLPQSFSGTLLAINPSISSTGAGGGSNGETIPQLPILGLPFGSSSNSGTAFSEQMQVQTRVNVLFCLRGLLESIEEGQSGSRDSSINASGHKAVLQRLESRAAFSDECQEVRDAASTLVRLCGASPTPVATLPCLRAHVDTSSSSSSSSSSSITPLAFLGKGGFSSVHALRCKCKTSTGPDNIERGMYALKRQRREADPTEPLPAIVDVYAEVRCLQRMSRGSIEGVCSLRGFGAIASTSTARGDGGGALSSEYVLLMDLAGAALSSWRADLTRKDQHMAVATMAANLPAHNGGQGAERVLMLLLLELFWDVCLVVQSVHALGVLHFDIKAANVLLAPTPTLLVLANASPRGADTNDSGSGATLALLLRLWPLMRQRHQQGRPSGVLQLCDFGEALVVGTPSNSSPRSDDCSVVSMVSAVAPPRSRGTLPIQAPEFIALSSGSSSGTASANATSRSTSRSARGGSSSSNSSARVPIAFPVAYPGRAADVWSLGCLLPELLLGRMLLEGRTWSELYVHLCTESALPMIQAAPSTGGGTGAGAVDLLSWGSNLLDSAAAGDGSSNSGDGADDDDYTGPLSELGLGQVKRPLHSLQRLCHRGFGGFLVQTGAAEPPLPVEEGGAMDVFAFVKALVDSTLVRRPADRATLPKLLGQLAAFASDSV